MDVLRFFTTVAVVVLCPSDSAGQSITLSSSVTFGDDTVLCPDIVVEFECIGINIETLQWRTDQVLVVYGIDTDGVPLTDIQPSQPPGYNFSLISFELSIGQGTRRTANFTAILRVELSVLESGEHTDCFRGESLNQSINVAYSTRNAPPATLFATNFTRGMDSSLNLNFYWNESFTRAHAVELYCISSVGVDECNTCVSPNTMFVCPQIMQGEATSFSVGAINCGSQYGENVTFTVNPQVPGKTTTCSSVPIYSSEPAGELIGIMNTWNLVPPNLSVYDPNIFNYILSINATNDESVLQKKEVCVPATNQCEYVMSLSETREDQLQTIAVSVTAENVVGRGEPQPCSPTISTTNRIFDTLVAGNESGTFVQCKFTTPSSQLTEECVFCYGNITQSCDQQSLTCFPPIVHAQDKQTGMASYDLPEEFCYQITAIVDGNTRAVVSGRVESECTLTDLYGGGSTVVSPPSDERCLNINTVGSVLIENGVICYNGTSTGSLATFHCNSGFQLKNGDGVQRCQSDSNWDGQIATCSQEPCLNAARFFFSVAVVVSIVTILFSLFEICKSRTISDKKFYTTAVSLVIALLCLLLVIIFYVSMESLQQSQPLCITSNLVSILSVITCVIFLSLNGVIYLHYTASGKRKHNLQTCGRAPGDGSNYIQLPKPCKAILGKSFRDDKAYGRHPSFAVNNHSLVVEVYEEWWFNKLKSICRKLQFRVGQFEYNRITWLGDLQYYCDDGYKPRVAMNNNNIVVAVHGNRSKDRCFYNVGSVNQETATIEWGEEAQFARGCCPAVAITDSKVILTWCENDTSDNNNYYRVGNINSEAKTIDWTDKETDQKFPVNISRLSIAINSTGRVVTAYWDIGKDGKYAVHCISGNLKEDDVIEWLASNPQTLVQSVTGKRTPPVVSINTQGYVVVVLCLKDNLLCRVGHTFYNRDSNNRNGELIMESSKDDEAKYEEGRYPAIAIDDESRIFEIHETNAPHTTELHYHIGEIKMHTV